MTWRISRSRGQEKQKPSAEYAAGEVVTVWAVLSRPILYRTTKDFLVHFGLKDLSELPSMEEFEELIRNQAAAEEEIPEEV